MTMREHIDFAKEAEAKDAQAADVSGLRIILASASPRRIDMMKRHGVSPLVVPADADETVPGGLDVRQAVMYLALKKALWVEDARWMADIPTGAVGAAAEPATHARTASVATEPDAPAIGIGTTAEPAAPAYIVAADTVVYKGRIIGKPADAKEAWDFLEELRGASHDVYTGVAILKLGEKKRKVFYEKTKVFFKDYSEKDLYDYIQSGEPLDKAGAYAIQGGFAPYIDHIEGDLNNVIGFPWRRFTHEISKM